MKGVYAVRRLQPLLWVIALAVAAWAGFGAVERRAQWTGQDVEAWGLLMRSSHLYPNGLEEALAALERQPGLSEAHYMAALHHFHAGRTAEGEIHMQEALRTAAAVLNGKLDDPGAPVVLPAANRAAYAQIARTEFRFHFAHAKLPIMAGADGRFAVPLSPFTILFEPWEDRFPFQRPVAAPFPKHWPRARLAGDERLGWAPPKGSLALPVWEVERSNGAE